MPPVAVRRELVVPTLVAWCGGLAAGATSRRILRHLKRRPFFGVDTTTRGCLPHHYDTRVRYFESLPPQQGGIVLLGDSLTENLVQTLVGQFMEGIAGAWDPLFADHLIRNRGINGDTTLGVLHRLRQVIRLQPAKLFLLIGGNDLLIGRPVSLVAQHYDRILGRICDESPQTQVYVQSVLPNRVTRAVPALNAHLRRLAKQYDAVYIDLYARFVDPIGRLDPRYTADGLHLLPAGNLIWEDALAPHLF